MTTPWQPHDTKKVLLLAISFFWTMGFTNVCYFLPVFYAAQGFSIKSAGLLVSAFYVTSVSLRPFIGSIVRKLGYRNMILLAGTISLASTITMALANTNFWLGFTARATLGLGSSLFQIALATYQAVAFNENVRGRAFSLIMAGCLLPMMTLVPLADWLLHNEQHHLYILLPILSSAGALLFAPFIPGLDKPAAPTATTTAARNPFKNMADCFKIPVFRPALIAFFLFCLTDATAAFMSTMTAHYGLMASLFLSSNAIVGVSVRLFCGSLLDKYPRWKLSTPAILITSGALLLASINPTPTSLILLGLVFGVAMGFGFPLHLALASDGVPEKLQPQAVSLSWFFMGVDFAIVPILMGWMGSRIGPVPTFRILCIIALAGACLTWFLWRQTMRPKTKTKKRASTSAYKM